MSSAIVVLGAPNDSDGNLSVMALSRCDLAYTYFSQNPHLKIICTGGVGAHFNTTSTPHAQYLKNYLMSKEVPQINFLPLVESRFTFEDALLAREVIEEHKITSLVIVTSEFHLPRAKLVFSTIFPQITFHYLAATTPLSDDELLKLEKHERDVMERERRNLSTLLR
ncbi:YdcF family protein [Shewanella woodyi]|uniref:YdcF family protein n=1 Tax=Shewanella woodyi TaxID=60961 RepID=UPI003748C47D